MYAKVIVDISHEKLDKGFDYRIPAHLDGEIYPGVQVNIPFATAAFRDIDGEKPITVSGNTVTIQNVTNGGILVLR